MHFSPPQFTLEANQKQANAKSNNGIFIAIFGGIFMLFASMIRINGIVIVCALLCLHCIMLIKYFAPKSQIKICQIKLFKIFSFVESPYPCYIHFIPYIIFVFGITLITITLSSGSSGHLEELSKVNLHTMLNIISQIRFDWFLGLDANINSLFFYIGIGVLIIMGIYAHATSDKASECVFFGIFVMGFLMLLILWVGFDTRFLYLLLPFLVFWCFLGISLIKQKYYRYPILLFVMFVIANLAFINVRDMANIKTNINPDNAYNAESKELYNFIIANTPKDSIIISFKPRILYLNTHRLTFHTPNIKRLDEADFVAWNGRYIRDIDGMQDINSKEFIAKTELVFCNADWKLFRVLK